MKSYKNLWEECIDYDNIIASITYVATHRKKKSHIKNIMTNIDEYAEIITDLMENYTPRKHKTVEICDRASGKTRNIIVPTFEESVIHHLMIRAMTPMLTKGMSKFTFASIPGRGIHKCAKLISNWLIEDKKNTKYCLKMDIKKFFESIDHDWLKSELKDHIHDKKFLKLAFKMIDTTDIGLPLGFYTSHWFANWLLQPLDHYIKEELKAKYYVRYMDDMVIFGSNKNKLHDIRKDISRWLDHHNLKLKDNWSVFRMEYIKGDNTRKGNVLEFIGFKFHRNYITIRKNILNRMKRKAEKIGKKGKCSPHDAHQMMSYLGWIKWSETYTVYKKYIQPHITIKKCKKIIAKYDKKMKSLKKFEV